jgi:hypothetical protein
MLDMDGQKATFRHWRHNGSMGSLWLDIEYPSIKGIFRHFLDNRPGRQTALMHRSQTWRAGSPER